jgi:hypothetical protein
VKTGAGARLSCDPPCARCERPEPLVAAEGWIAARPRERAQTAALDELARRLGGANQPQGAKPEA